MNRKYMNLIRVHFAKAKRGFCILSPYQFLFNHSAGPFSLGHWSFDYFKGGSSFES